MLWNMFGTLPLAPLANHPRGGGGLSLLLILVQKSAPSIVAPLGSLTLVANVLIAPCMLGERVTRRDLFATGVIMFGCILAVAFAEHETCGGLHVVNIAK